MRIIAIAASILLLTGPVLAGTQVDWADLIDPSAQTFEDPYRDLSYEHLEAVATVARSRAQLTQAELTKDARSQIETRLSDAQEKLSAAGIDADWLIAQRWVVAERRERAASAGNPAVDGVEATLAGYAIPAPADENGTPVAYLVPERGMCAHMPPPPPNQMVRLHMPADWTPRMMHEPLQVTGKLTINPTEQEVVVVDGFVPMHATFALQVQDLKTIGKAGPRVSQETSMTNAWAARIVDGMRAADASNADDN
ncbi:DUF3299 domain-containing protein [Seohaeicola saemankumensis]|nr:DUF3299 domain-containing protein [Seohaeicola saemankumensis]MCA0872965.1 DUF3299 domain-containing protein [Seohaeicola saemankumensis]